MALWMCHAEPSGSFFRHAATSGISVGADERAVRPVPLGLTADVELGEDPI
jgi:hypothetical protein